MGYQQEISPPVYFHLICTPVLADRMPREWQLPEFRSPEAEHQHLDPVGKLCVVSKSDWHLLEWFDVRYQRAHFGEIKTTRTGCRCENNYTAR